MTAVPLSSSASVILNPAELDRLIAVLSDSGYQVIGPTLRDGAVVYEPLPTAAGLPWGWSDRQEGGSYRLVKSERDAAFDYVVGPQSWKRYLYPPVQRLWQAQRRGKDFLSVTQNSPTPRYAFFGVRSCELHALQIQDRVFNNGSFTDPGYLARRAAAFIVAVNCARPTGTCFCASMNTGPKANEGFDLALTELLDSNQHEFLVDVGSSRGATILERLPYRPANQEDLEAAQAVWSAATQSMERTMIDGVETLLKNNLEHDRWDDVGQRCLNCGNCTLVCPTCFCTTMEDTTDLTGRTAERRRKWDSCFTLDFSYIHGGSIRRGSRSRYRQWLTHKLATWHEQFGSSGCVGCGRCITWCPVGIDLTEETRAIRDNGG
ncbi:MAG: 4Fe-4S dicluster domain-containing protein [Candidatus Competibacteraceae bacterium]